MWHHAITLQPALGLCGRHVREFGNVKQYFSTPPEIETLVSELSPYGWFCQQRPLDVMIIAEKCPNFKWRQITSLLLDMKSVKVLEGTFYKYQKISDCPSTPCSAGHTLISDV